MTLEQAHETASNVAIKVADAWASKPCGAMSPEDFAHGYIKVHETAYNYVRDKLQPVPSIVPRWFDRAEKPVAKELA